MPKETILNLKSGISQKEQRQDSQQKFSISGIALIYKVLWAIS
jgi:hypothetical protein